MLGDRVEREITIEAPVERVWSVLTEAEHVGKWFGQGEPTPVDLRPGGIMELDHGKHGRYLTTIVTVDRPRYFSYRWASGYPGVVADERNSTLVEFTLIPDGSSTRLRVAESGFTTRTVPADQRPDDTFDSHSAGWLEVLGNLRKYAVALSV